MGKTRIKLHIGCGDIYKKGYVNVDAFNSSVADVMAKADKLPYSDESVDIIENYHLLEHLDIEECDVTLKEWYRVLRQGGQLIIEVPDLEKNLKIFLDSSYHERWENYRKEFKHGRIQTIYGKGSEDGQLHKTGFDKERLKKLLQNHGFVKIKIFFKKGTPIKRENLIATCEKPKNYFKKKKFRDKDLLLVQINSSKVSLPREYLRKIKSWIVYSLRRLADTIEEIKYPKF